MLLILVWKMTKIVFKALWDSPNTFYDQIFITLTSEGITVTQVYLQMKLRDVCFPLWALIYSYVLLCFDFIGNVARQHYRKWNIIERSDI